MNIHNSVFDKSQIEKAAAKVKNPPQVSIGMPVYNSEPFIREALDSLLAQTFTDFELIISDNASTDSTEAICLKYAERDTRIKYIRQTKNIGPVPNFKFVLDEAVGEYFMWAAADDVRSGTFLEINSKFLINNNDYVASTSPTRFKDGNFNPIAMGDFALEDDDSNLRVFNFFKNWHANARFYSLIRRDVLLANPFMHLDFVAIDWLWVIYLASKGKIAKINQGYVILGSSGESNTKNIFKNYNKNFISFIIPFWKFMRLTHHHFLKNIPFSLSMYLFCYFFYLNFLALILNIRWFILRKRT
jgi:glycosyltransferase involved in cell wall biosynthesis